MPETPGNGPDASPHPTNGLSPPPLQDTLSTAKAGPAPGAGSGDQGSDLLPAPKEDRPGRRWAWPAGQR